MKNYLLSIFLLLVLGLAIFFGYLFYGRLEVNQSVVPIIVDQVIVKATPPQISVPSSSSSEIKKTPIVEKPAVDVTVIATTTKPLAKIIKFTVSFTAQAPFGEWSDPRQQNACEEASALMAVYWARGKSFTLQEAKAIILAMSDWQEDKYGFYQDASAYDTVERIYKEYFGFTDVRLVDNISYYDIINELETGNLVVVPTNGQALGNKFFHAPGPEEHMLVIIGYDYGTKEFITNDPGTRSGRNYRYDQKVLFEAIRNYPTGYHLPIVGVEKVMIVVHKI